MDSHEKGSGQIRPHSGSDNTAPYGVSRLAPAMGLVDLAKEIEHADKLLNTRVGAKLQVIADQIRSLQNEARAALQEAQRDQALHRAHCNFKRRPGNIYHLYRKADGSRYFSMLAPRDWGGKPPHAFEGSYRLENDMSWTAAENLDAADDSRQRVQRLLEDH
jgi:hypothetical protein